MYLTYTHVCTYVYYIDRRIKNVVKTIIVDSNTQTPFVTDLPTELFHVMAAKES